MKIRILSRNLFPTNRRMFMLGRDYGTMKVLATNFPACSLLVWLAVSFTQKARNDGGALEAAVTIALPIGRQHSGVRSAGCSNQSRFLAEVI